MNLALSGKLACGKSVLANFLKEEHHYTIVSIGSMIKKVTNVVIEDQIAFAQYVKGMVEDKQVAERLVTEITNEFNTNFQHMTFEKDGDELYVKNNAYRQLTQYIATVFRKTFGEDIWVTFVAKEAINMTKEGKKIVCDDLRLPSEKEIFQSYGFKIIRLDVSEATQKMRIQARGDGKISHEQLNHPTEIALDNAEFDVRLNTDTMSMEAVNEFISGYLQMEAIQ